MPEIKALAASEVWQTREVAATALVEIGKRHAANPHTQWIVKDGLRKLKTSRPREVAAILASLVTPSSR